MAKSGAPVVFQIRPYVIQLPMPNCPKEIQAFDFEYDSLTAHLDDALERVVTRWLKRVNI